MHYTVQVKIGEQVCSLVKTGDRRSITVKSRNATAFETYRGATEEQDRLLGMSPKELRLLIRRESDFSQSVQILVKSWRNDITAPMTVRSKMYTFQTQD